MGYKGNDGDKNNGGMAHYNDLREIYARQMEYHGCGFGLFQPISAQDMTPPCAGYFDRNGDWNLICNLSTSPQAQKPLHVQGDPPAQPFAPLKYDPIPTSRINIEWQPKTSQDTTAHVLNAGGQTPDNLPAGADVNIKYSSKSKFGAVLMTLRPISLTAYNDERLFMDWLNNNRGLLYTTYGAELKKYGLWVVTRTYSAPGCSINAWQDNSKESTVSLKAKASMMGELADGEMQWNDKMTDKDWSHYKAKDGDGLVVFMDGIECPKSEWWIEGVRQKLGGRSPSAPPNRRHSNSPPTYYDPNTILPPQIGEDGIVSPRRRSPLGQEAGYLRPPSRAGDNRYDHHSQDAGIPTTIYTSGYAKTDIGVMPTWSENTAGPNTHGGTQNIIPRNDNSGGYLIGSPIQKKVANRTDSGFASMFTKMAAPTPWDGIESPVIGRQNASAAAAASAPPAPPASAPAAMPAVAPAPSLVPAAAPTAAATATAPPAQSQAQTHPLAQVADVPTAQSSPPQGSTTPASPPLPKTPSPAPRQDPQSWRLSANGWTIDFHAPPDEETLKDAGITQLNRRSVSVRRTSDASSIGRPSSIAESFLSRSSMGRTKSLRRETRSISGQSIKDGKEGMEGEVVYEEDEGHRRKSMAV